MEKLIFNYQTAVLSLLLFTVFSCIEQEKKTYMEADIKAINELYNQATLACNTGDVELYLSLFSENVRVMASESPVINGKKELKQVIEGLFDIFDLELPYTLEEIEVIKDMAYVRSTFLYSMTAKEKGETITRAGKELDILKKQADGSWKIFIECWNFDTPPIVE